MDLTSAGMQIIQARVPLTEMSSYARSLQSMTGGQGSYTMEFSHYEPMPPHEQQKVIAAAQHPEDEDS
jgi:elongation factor G